MDRIAYQNFADLERTHFWFVSRRRIFFDLLDRELGSRQDRQVLEIGCGPGGMLQPMTRYGAVTGLDIDHEYLVHARERGCAQVLVGSGYELPFPDRSFDVVAMFDTLEHIPDDLAAVREVTRVLKPGGTLFVSGPAYQWLWSQNDEIAHHRRRYTTGRLAAVIEQGGLRLVRRSYFNTLLLPMIVPTVLWQKLRWKLGKLPPGYNNTTVPLPGWLNRLFTWVMSSERHWLRRLPLPVGHSLIAIARRP